VQIDELDLAWEDEADRGRHRRRAQQRANGKKKKSRGGKSFLALTISLLVLAGLVAGGWYGVNKVQSFLTAPDYNSGGTGEATVQVLDGQTLTDVGQTLQKAGVVKSAKAFVEAAKSNGNSQKLQPGFYKVRKQMRAADALTLMLDPASRLVSKVTLPEGITYQETFAKLSQATNIPVADFETAAKDPTALGVADFWFTRGDGKPVQKSIEGFLYPATYQFNPGATATSVLKTVIAKFNEEMTKTDFINQVQQNLHISPFEALIAASIAQVEGIFPEDQANIARVLYNRAYGGKFPCNCLQLDSTVNYWLRISGKTAKQSQDLLHSELHNPADPYNTHDKPGLPIGPISNPGNSALLGAMNAPKNTFVYFVAIDKQGHTAFATTLAQHNANIAIAKKNGVL
jgi:UPF0755 protein